MVDFVVVVNKKDNATNVATTSTCTQIWQADKQRGRGGLIGILE